MSSVQLLDKTRKIGKLLHNNNSSKVSKELGKRVVCTGGFHKDGISEKEIREVQGSVVRLTEMVIEGLQR